MTERPDETIDDVRQHRRLMQQFIAVVCMRQGMVPGQNTRIVVDPVEVATMTEMRLQVHFEVDEHGRMVAWVQSAASAGGANG